MVRNNRSGQTESKKFRRGAGADKATKRSKLGQWLARMTASALALCLLFGSQVVEAVPSTHAKAYALLEASTGRILAAENSDEKLPMASTTKIMTCLLALENCDLNEMVTVEKEAVGLEGTSMYLREGETLTVSDLVYGLMLSSGNDAAAMLAIHMAGSLEEFAKMMNARAKEIGATNTNFVTPNGLPDENHYTTAYDLALIASEAMQNPLFREVVATRQKDLPADEDSPARYLRSKNRMLTEYEGGNGIKTGYTKKAGKCLVAGAERDGMQLVSVVLNDYDMWKDSKALMDYGFQEYKLYQMGRRGENYGTIPVLGGVQPEVSVALTADIYLPLTEKEVTMVEKKVNLVEGLEAPVAAGKSVGKVEYWLDGVKFAEAEIKTSSSVLENSYAFNLRRILRRWLLFPEWRSSANSEVYGVDGSGVS